MAYPKGVLPVGIVELVIVLFFAILAILCIAPFWGLWEVAKEYKNILMLCNGSSQSIKQDGESNTMWTHTKCLNRQRNRFISLM